MMTASKRNRYKKKELILTILDWWCLISAIYIYYVDGPITYALGMFVFSLFFQAQIASLKSMERVDELETVVFNTRK